jgi:ubiquinone/menaquinone biosynthesis C-methylase UbiE
MTQETRERVRETYSKSGVEYDRERLTDPRGRMLSDYDVRLFHGLLPPPDSADAALEVGAGTGRFTLPAVDQGYRVIATDINEVMLEQLRQKIQQIGAQDKVTVQQGDIFNLSFPDAQFSFAFGLHVIPRFNTLEDQRAAILEVARTIKPGGRFLFNYRNRSSLVYGRMHKGHAATPQQMSDILREAGMRVVNVRGKMLLNRTLINKLPLAMGKLLAFVDARLARLMTGRAWDVFVVAQKDAAQSK